MEPIALTAAVTLALGLSVWAWNLARNRSFTGDVPVFHASRWTRGNRVWPTQVAVFARRVVRYTPVSYTHLTLPTILRV